MSYKVYARHGGAVAATTDEITSRVPALDDDNVPLIKLSMSFQNGGASQGTFIVPDPVGNMDDSLYFPPRTQVTWTEDASGDELWLAQGRVSLFEIGRGDVKSANNVQWNLTVDDPNVDVRDLALTEDWVRPEETGTARLYALALYTLNGTSSTRPDFGGSITYRPSTTIIASSSHLAPDTNTTIMPAKTYPIDTQPGDVLTDIASTEGKVWGVVIHDVAGASHLCLEYILPNDHSTYASPCKISDDLDDWDPDDLTAPVFEPIYDQGNAQRVDGNAFISGVVSRFGAGADQVEVLLDTTLADATEYAVASYQDGDSTTQAQAQARAAAIIAYRSPYTETDSVSINVLPEQQHLIRSGMSLQVKAAPINTSNDSSIGTYIDRRIVSLEWAPLPDGRYHGALQLNKPQRGPGAGVGRLQSVSTVPTGAPACGTTFGCIETFSRSESNGWGISPCGATWTLDDFGEPTVDAGASVNGSEGVLTQILYTPPTPDVYTSPAMALPLTLPTVVDSRFEALFKWRIITIGTDSSLEFFARGAPTNTADMLLVLDVGGISGGFLVQAPNASTSFGVFPGYEATLLAWTWATGVDYLTRFQMGSTFSQGKVWIDGDPEPGYMVWSITATPFIGSPVPGFRLYPSGAGSTAGSAAIDYMKIVQHSPYCLEDGGTAPFWARADDPRLDGSFVSSTRYGSD